MYSDKGHYQSRQRKELIPLLRLFWKDQAEFSTEDQAKAFGDWVRSVSITDSAEEARVAVLPMSWNYYAQAGKQQDAAEFILKARQAGLEVLTWSSGDFGVAPFDNNVLLYCSCGYQSKRLAKQYALPVFFDDPLPKHYKVNRPLIRQKGVIPVVGFCGQAYAPWYKNVYDVLRTFSRNLQYALNLSVLQPQKLYPATLLRHNALNVLTRAEGIKTNFIIRKEYRAGAKSAEDKARTTLEYYQNMVDSDYIVCMRGNGNFSKRLYETLAMGRIPILVDADGIYPDDQHIDWKKAAVWVDAKDMKQLGTIVSNFHKSISDEDFRERQFAARQLWEERLSMSGFFSTLTSRLNEVI